jgi:hypothetical protein
MIAISIERFGSWKCGKGRTFTTFPQALLFFICVLFTNKIIMQGGENKPNPFNPFQKPLLMQIYSKLLTILFYWTG